MNEMTENYVKIAPSDSGFYQTLVDEIKEIENHLNSDQELDIIINNVQFRVEYVKHDLDFLCILGTDASGQAYELVCHEHSFSGVLVIVPKRAAASSPTKIGFVDNSKNRE